MMVFTIAVIARRAAIASRGLPCAGGGGAGGMIDMADQAGIAVLTLKHGKANALDIEFCEALAARFTDLRESQRQGGGTDRAGQDIFRRRRSEPCE